MFLFGKIFCCASTKVPTRCTAYIHNPVQSSCASQQHCAYVSRAFNYENRVPVIDTGHSVHLEPQAKKFTEGQLKPAADKVAANAKPMADKFNKEQLLPAADKVANQARPLADKLTEGQIRPGAQRVADEAVPRTKDFTENQLQPAAKRVADNAEAAGEKVIKEGIEPLADVSSLPLVVVKCIFC